MTLGQGQGNVMFFNSLVGVSTSVFGSQTMGLELLATTALGVSVLFYLARVGWIALSDVHRMELKAVRSPVLHNRYSGSSTAG